jgi:hypothetical protein
MVRQSKTLRRLSEELLQESKDIKASAAELRQKPKGRKKK